MELAIAPMPRPCACARWETCSKGEREVAHLAAGGLSDVNISTRLSISESIVGRHLHNIFRKLGVGSRLELNDLALTRD